MTRIVLSLALLSALFGGCASAEPVTEDLHLDVDHSPEFMWEQARAALASRYDIETEDQETRTLTSGWKTQLSPFSHFGYRTRLVVTLEGDVDQGYDIGVSEEREVNTEEVNPMAPSEAEWEPEAGDGADAARFLVDLRRQLNPSQRWRDDIER